MCGIAGAFSIEDELPPDVIAAVDEIRQALTHRGPDASGTWISADRRVALAATRLAVRDLRSVANQPFISSAGATVYNGELYAWPADVLRRGHARTSGDTEIIHALTCEDASQLTRVSGMYAVATYKAATRSLILARDPAGEKPLYLIRQPRWIAFASELKALVAVGLLRPQLNRDAVALLLRLGHVPDALTIYEGADVLRGGTILEIAPDGRESVQTWWPQPLSGGLTAERLRMSVIDAVRSASIADVPTGIFLSGGIDSSVIAAASSVSGCDVTAFTLTGSPRTEDESIVAASTARHFDLPHHVIPISPDEARELLPSFFKSMDQPTVDGFNSYLISRAARSAGLTVALSGVGGDELFRGYPSFQRMDAARWLLRLPIRTRSGRVRSALERRQERAGDLLRAKNSVEAYFAIRGVLSVGRVERLLGCSFDWDAVLARVGLETRETGDRETTLLEITEYMRSQLLRDIDVFSMASALEVRAPLLAPSLIAFAGALPNDRRLRGKRLLKEAFRRELPPAVLSRPKTGFTLPWDDWLKHTLRGSSWTAIWDFARAQSVIDLREARRLWADFESGRVHWSALWVLVALSHWGLVQRSAKATDSSRARVMNSSRC
jgi:asparagine synthase (glutamine-hydrolysing)